MRFLGESLFLRLRQGRVRGSVGEALGSAVVLLDFFLAEGVDDLRRWVHALFEEVTFDSAGVWFELGRSLRRFGQSFHGESMGV